MGASENLTINFGNWVEEVTLTKLGDKKHTNKFEVYNKTIERFVRELPEPHSKNETKGCEEDIIQGLELPQFQTRFDLQNSNKYSKKIQRWQGVVLGYNKSSFKARLKDLTSRGTDEIAELDMEDVSPEDKPLVIEGAVFYWSVGYYMENGQIIKQSDIRFQRLIPLDADEFELAMQKVESKLLKLKKREIDNNTSSAF